MQSRTLVLFTLLLTSLATDLASKIPGEGRQMEEEPFYAFPRMPADLNPIKHREPTQFLFLVIYLRQQWLARQREKKEREVDAGEVEGNPGRTDPRLFLHHITLSKFKLIHHIERFVRWPWFSHGLVLYRELLPDDIKKEIVHLERIAWSALEGDREITPLEKAPPKPVLSKVEGRLKPMAAVAPSGRGYPRVPLKKSDDGRIIVPIITSFPTKGSDVIIGTQMFNATKNYYKELRYSLKDRQGKEYPFFFEFKGNNPDSNADGVLDGAEVQQGTDPLSGRPVRTGIIATVDTPGTAVTISTRLQGRRSTQSHCLKGSYKLSVPWIPPFRRERISGFYGLESHN
ncbi:hypothetical protein IH992_22415 [Candidatus Poribacteria bacterium]|nr:hypothetical protein [Candidatus Poribacteria bacterium]